MYLYDDGVHVGQANVPCVRTRGHDIMFMSEIRVFAVRTFEPGGGTKRPLFC